MLNIHVRRQQSRMSMILPAAIAVPLSAAAGVLMGFLFFRRRPKIEAGSTKRVDQMMTPNPKAIEPSASVVDAAKLMRTQNVGSLPIVQDNRLVGMVTDRDIALRVVADGEDPNATPIGTIASSNPVTVTPEANLDDALNLMAKHQVRRLPVVQNGGRLVGIVAQADVALEGSDKSTGEVVEQISR
jgi:CBS domain-containing protein